MPMFLLVFTIQFRNIKIFAHLDRTYDEVCNSYSIHLTKPNVYYKYTNLTKRGKNSTRLIVVKKAV